MITVTTARYDARIYKLVIRQPLYPALDKFFECLRIYKYEWFLGIERRFCPLTSVEILLVL